MAEMTPYELQRQANISKNLLQLQALELSFVQNEDTQARGRVKDESTATVHSKKYSLFIHNLISKRRPAKRPKLGTRNGTRVSARLTNSSTPEILKVTVEEETPESHLLTFDEFFDEETRAKAIRSEGHYRGWISQRIMDTYGIAHSASEAWESNGGGKFTFSNTAGQGISGGVKPSGWSTAKFNAFKVRARLFFTDRCFVKIPIAISIDIQSQDKCKNWVIGQRKKTISFLK